MDVVEPAMVVRIDQAATRPSWRHRLEYAGLRAAVALARIAPIEATAAIGAGVMRMVGPRLRQNRRALLNIARAFPDLPARRHAEIARDMWANMGRSFAETVLLDRIVADPARIEIADRERWAASVPESIVACTLHMGNWELLAGAASDFGRIATGVYKPLDNPLIDGWLRRQRNFLYPGGLLGKGDRRDSTGTGQRTARRLIDKARSGGCLCFVVDHFDRRGEPVPFMGAETRFTTAPATIARHVGAQIWVGRCLRLGARSRFRIELEAIDVPRTADKRADSAAATVAMFAVFERWIRENPEQWMWWNTRWMDTPAKAKPPA